MSYGFGGRMGESVEVVTSELHLAADRLRGAGQRLQDGLSAVDLETGNLLASGWKGEAATAFDTYWEQWHNGAGQVVRALQTMSEALDTAATNYQAADEQAGGALGSTMQSGGGSGAGTGGGAPTAGGAPTGAGAAGAEDTGGPTGAPSGLAEQMNLGGTMAPMSQAAGIPAQVAGQVAGGLMQAGTMAAGVAQQAVQAATQLAQEAHAAAAESEAVEVESEKPQPEAAAGGEAPAGPAPVEAPRAGAGTSGPEETPGRSL
ncbi:WXG100 family type VII secretion target [Mycolicibacterium frederiksbergense]|uniref:WXG100 family type VII secretion target n=1 Tax=Mycolicibacterium frederiksbergense TaxID=117567 RepID=UPI00265C3182|nr:WXG100 family type VII secretion target [Mycolicibacterium frederiksbergense]MDO0974297.1 WXG100 family type VII secretion target [Mycolicibacterium frederiksbergense]